MERHTREYYEERFSFGEIVGLLLEALDRVLELEEDLQDSFYDDSNRGPLPNWPAEESGNFATMSPIFII
jgi:hypothetical protein